MTDSVATTSKADLLIRYLYLRGSGTSSQLREASEYCFGAKENFVAVARRLCALGHIECDWDGPQLRWRVVPSAFFSVSGRFGLCGVLSLEDEERIIRAGLKFINEPVEFGSGTITRRYVVDADGIAGKVLKAPPLSLPVAQQAFYDLLQRIAPLANLHARQSLAALPSVALRFSLTTRRFDREISEPQAEDGLLKEIGYGKPTYYFQGKKVDGTVGLWLAMAVDPTRLARCSETELEIPAFPELPPLYERVLYFAGAVRQTCGSSIVFRNVDHGITQRITAKLGLRTIKETSKL